jgi:hypothetical protein
MSSSRVLLGNHLPKPARRLLKRATRKVGVSSLATCCSLSQCFSRAGAANFLPEQVAATCPSLVPFASCRFLCPATRSGCGLSLTYFWHLLLDRDWGVQQPAAFRYIGGMHREGSCNLFVSSHLRLRHSHSFFFRGNLQEMLVSDGMQRGDAKFYVSKPLNFDIFSGP